MDGVTYGISIVSFTESRGAEIEMGGSGTWQAAVEPRHEHTDPDAAGRKIAPRHPDSRERRCFRLDDRRTSVCLLPEEWKMLETVAKRERVSIKAMLNHIDATRGGRPVPSAMRVFLLSYWQDAAAGRGLRADLPPRV